MKLKYVNKDLGELGLQLALSPRHLRLKQIAGIDRLLDLAVPGKSYPYDLVSFHITGTQPMKQNQRAAIPMADLLADLSTLAEHITRRSAVPASALEGEYMSLDALSAHLEVSTKTIRRWRSRGLVGVRAAGDNGKSRMLFSAKTVKRFTDRNKDVVKRGASFKLLSEAERQTMVDLAREMLAAKRQKLHVIARAVSAETGRAVETVRYTIRQYDAANPEQALFARNGEPVVAQRHLAIWRCNQKGETPAQIAEAFSTSVRKIKAILRELQARQLKNETFDYVDNELFHAPNADDLILNVARPAPATDTKKVRAPKGLPAYMRALYDTPLLGRAEEADLFRRYNYVRFCLARAVEALDVLSVSQSQLDAIEHLQQQADALRNEIVLANLRLVVSIGKRHVGPKDNFFEVVSDGNMTLMRTVDKFDFALGNKFSTYATWSVMKNFARTVPEQHYRNRRYVTGQDELLDCTADQQETEQSPSDLETVRNALCEGMEQLNDREQTIVKAHFGLFEPDGTATTLSELGKRFGVTKERIRQIEYRAIEKLREFVSPTLLDAFTN